MKEQFDRKDLTDTKQNIDDKTAAVAKDKQDLSDLEDALRQAGGDAGLGAAAIGDPSLLPIFIRDNSIAVMRFFVAPASRQRFSASTTKI